LDYWQRNIWPQEIGSSGRQIFLALAAWHFIPERMFWKARPNALIRKGVPA